jgi:hypothetical protein
MDPGGDRWEDVAVEMCRTSEGVSPARSVMPAAAQDLTMQSLWRCLSFENSDTAVCTRLSTVQIRLAN